MKIKDYNLVVYKLRYYLNDRPIPYEVDFLNDKQLFEFIEHNRGNWAFYRVLEIRKVIFED